MAWCEKKAEIKASARHCSSVAVSCSSPIPRAAKRSRGTPEREDDARFTIALATGTPQAATTIATLAVKKYCQGYRGYPPLCRHRCPWFPAVLEWSPSCCAWNSQHLGARPTVSAFFAESHEEGGLFDLSVRTTFKRLHIERALLPRQSVKS